MARPRILPPDGIRRTITLPSPLDEEIALHAARKRTSVSIVIRDLLESALRPSSLPHEATRPLDPRSFPKDWDGKDLRIRLIDLRIRQNDLAKAIGVHPHTFNSWIRGHYAFPEGILASIQRAISGWDHENRRYRWGPRSPGT